MTEYHLARITTVLTETFAGKIDMSDLGNRPDEQIRNAFLSRALAALYVKGWANASDDIAAGAVVDGYDDGGIDAILFDQVDDIFYFVQAKLGASDQQRSNPTRKRSCFCHRHAFAEQFENLGARGGGAACSCPYYGDRFSYNKHYFHIPP